MSFYVDPSLPSAEQEKIARQMVEKFTSLLRHPGWLDLDAYLKQEELNAFNALQASQTGDLAMKNSGGYAAIRRVRELPERILNVALQHLQELTKK